MILALKNCLSDMVNSGTFLTAVARELMFQASGCIRRERLT